MKFRKKPVVIDAWPVKDVLKAAAKSWRDLPKIVAMAYENGDVIFRPNNIDVKTLEGWMVGNIEDMLIAGVHSELYPCKLDIFAKTYEAVTE